MEGNIDQLNFEVILDHKNFDKEIEAVKKAAQEFNTTMSGALDITERFAKNGSSNIKHIKESLDEAGKSAKTLGASFKTVSKAAGQTNATLLNTRSVMSSIAQLTGVAFGAAGVRRFLSTLIDVTGQFEVQRMALGAMLQDSDKADKIFGQFRQLALESPYTFQEFTKFGKQLTAFNIPAEQLVGTTKMLADVAAGLGVDMQRIILAYGQIKSAGVLKGTELRQLTEAGVPILDSLAKQIEKTTGKTVQLAEVFDMISKKQIPFAMVEQAFKDMTSEGGKFYDMQSVLVETLAGKIGKLKDTWQQALYDIGNAQSGILKGGVDFVTNVIANYEKIGKALVAVVAGYGAYRVALFAVTLALRGYTASQIVARSTTIAFAAVNRVLNKTLLANPYVAVAAGVLALVAAMTKLVRVSRDEFGFKQDLNKVQERYLANTQTEIEEVKLLLTRMERLNPTEEKYAELKERILGKYGDYLSKMDKENLEVGNLAGMYDRLARSVREASKQRFLDEGRNELNSTLDDGIKRIRRKLKNMLGGMGIDTEGELMDYIYGEVGRAGLSKETSAIINGMDEINDITGETTNDIDILRNEYSRLIQQYADGEKRLERVFGKVASFTGGNNAPLADWQQKVKDTIAGDSDDETLFGFKEGENWETYYTRMAGEYDKVCNDLSHAWKESDIKLFTRRKETLERLNKEFGGALLPSSKEYKKGLKESETEQEKLLRTQTAGIKAQISNLLKLKDSYDSLAQNPLIGEENAKSLMQMFYGETDLNFEKRITDLTSALIALNPELDEYVKGIKDAFGKDSVNDYLKSLTAFDTIDDKITEYLSKDFGIEGEDIAAKISKALTDTFNKNIKVDLDTEKMIKDLEKAKSAITTNYLIENADSFKEAGWTEQQQREMADAYWEEYKKRRIKEIEDQAKQEKAYNEKNTQELVKGFAEGIYKKLTRELDLTDWAQKSVGEIETIKRSLENIDLPEDIKKVIKDPDLLNALTEALKELANADLGKADEKESEKRLKNWSRTAKAIDLATSALKEFGEASGNNDIVMLANRLDDITKTASSMIQAIATKDMPTAIASLVSYEVNSIMSLITANVELKRSIREMAEEARRQSFSSSLSSGVANIFGTNDFRKVDNAIKSMEKIQRLTRADRGANRSMDTSKRAKWWEFMFGQPTAMAAWASLFSKQSESLASMSAKLGMELYDEYGNLNAATLQKILDTYSNLKQADKDWIQQAINNSEAYSEAMKQVDDVMQSLFGDIANKASDAIVNSWIEAGNAALDYADILDDVAQSYAKMVIKSMIFDEVLNDEAIKALKDEFLKGDTEAAMTLVEQSLQQIADMAPVFDEILSSFDPYFVREETSSSSSGGSLSAGIKSITEETANLLASYVNAMRADLSVIRGMQTSGWQDVRLIREAIQNQYAPNYNEYMAQIAANTYDTAQSNNEILSRLRSIITVSTNGGSAVRTTK